MRRSRALCALHWGRYLQRGKREPTLPPEMVIGLETIDFVNEFPPERQAFARCICSDLDPAKVKKVIKYHRESLCPVAPQSPLEAINALRNSPVYSHLYKDHVILDPEPGQDQHQVEYGIILFPEELRSKLGLFRSLFADGTFKRCPLLFFQLLAPLIF